MILYHFFNCFKLKIIKGAYRDSEQTGNYFWTCRSQEYIILFSKFITQGSKKDCSNVRLIRPSAKSEILFEHSCKGAIGFDFSKERRNRFLIGHFERPMAWLKSYVTLNFYVRFRYFNDWFIFAVKSVTKISFDWGHHLMDLEC